MKKILLTTIVMLLVLLGCSSNEEPKENQVYHIGSASVTSVVGLDADEDLAKDGKVEVTTTFAHVVLNSDKEFVYVFIDSAQNAGTFNDDGEVLVAEVSLTKKEKGPAYGMASNSAINKEWFEQIASFEAYLIGKKVSALNDLSVEEGYLADTEDLKSSVTMAVGEYIEVVKKATENIVEVSNVATAGIASTTTINSKDATDESTGKIEIEVTFTGVALDSQDNVLYAYIDTAQNLGTFDDDGVVVEAKAAQSKKEKGDAYGLIDVSSINKNWYQQVEALEEWMVNQSVSDVKSLSVSEGKISDDEDLKSSVTISVSAYLNAFDQATSAQQEISQ